MRTWLTATLLLALTGLPARAQEGASKPTPQGKLALSLDPGRHTDTIYRVVFSADGKQLTTLAKDGAIRIWDIETGEPVRVLYPPGLPQPWNAFDHLRATAVSRDGKRVVLTARYPENGKEVQVLYVLSLPDGRIERVLRDHRSRIAALALSPDGKLLVSASSTNGVLLSDLTVDAPPKQILAGKPVFALAFSADGQQVAWTLYQGKGGIVDVESGKAVATIEGRHVALAWSPDGQTLATVEAGSRSVRFHDRNGKLLRTATLPGRFQHMAFSPDSQKLLCVWDTFDAHRATLLDVASATEVRKFVPTAHTPPRPQTIEPHGGAFSADGQLVATVGGSGMHTIFVWRTSDGVEQRRIDSAPWMFGGADYVIPAWSKDGRSVCWCAAHRAVGTSNPLLRSATFNLHDLKFVETLPRDQRHQSTLEKDGLMAKDGVIVKRRSARQIEVLRDDRLVGVFGCEAAALVEPGWVMMRVGSLVGATSTWKMGGTGGYGWGRLGPDSRYMMLIDEPTQKLSIWTADKSEPLLTLYRKGEDWIIWTKEGYYAATPGGERLIAWKRDNGIDQMPTVYPAEQFRNVLYRPDVIRLAFQKGSVAEAIKIADAARKEQGRSVAPVVASPRELLPPGVTLQVDQSRLPLVTVNVHARSAVAEQPIKSLRLLVDGLRLPDGQADVTFAPGKELPEHKTGWTVELPPGPHKLAVLALSKDYTPNLSNPVTVRCPMVGKERPAIHHLAVGVSKYRTVTPALNVADKDARELRKAISDSVRNGLAYGPGEAFELLNQGATRDAVLDKIDAVRKRARAGDLFVLSFAGHGVRDNGEFFLLTHEANQKDADTLRKTAISGAALRKALDTFPCQVLVLLDACHAGAVGGMPGGADDAARSLSDVDLRVAVMCAALGHEKAREDKGNGLFTAAVIRALQRDPDAFFDRATGEMTVYHLTAFVEQEVRKRSEDMQHPYLKMPLSHPAFNVVQFMPMSPAIQK